MQQICAEAGMSPGALYRYFPSKEAIVEAICEADRAEDAELFASVLQRAGRRRGHGDGAMAHIRHMHETNAAPLFAEIMRRSPCATRRSRRPAIENMERGAGDVRSGYIGRAIERGEIDPPVELDVLLPTLMAIATAWRSTTCRRSGVPLEKLEIVLRAHGRGHAAPDRQTHRRLSRCRTTSSDLSDVMSQQSSYLRFSRPRCSPAHGATVGHRPGLRRAKPRLLVSSRRRRSAWLRPSGANWSRRCRSTAPIVAREEAAAGTDLNGMIVTALNADIGDMREKGRRACRARPLDARHAARADAGDPRTGGGEHRPDGRPDRRRRGRASGRPTRRWSGPRRCRRRASPPRRNSTMPRTPPTAPAPSWNRRKRRWPPRRRSSRVIDAQKKAIAGADRQDRGDARRPMAWCWRATRRWAASSRRQRAAVPHRDRCRVRTCGRTSPRPRCRGFPTGMPAEDLACRRGRRDRRQDPPDFARSRPEVAARPDPHRAADRRDRRAPAVSRAARSRLVRREGVAVPASAVIYARREAFLQKVADGKVKTVPVTLGVRADGYRRGRLRRRRGRRGGRARRHLRRRRRHGDAGARRGNGSDQAMNWNFSAWAIRNPVPPILLFIVLDRARADELFEAADHALSEHRRADRLRHRHRSGRGAERTGNAGHQARRGRGRQYFRRQERHLDDHRRPVADGGRVPPGGRHADRGERRQGRRSSASAPTCRRPPTSRS